MSNIEQEIRRILAESDTDQEETVEEELSAKQKKLDKDGDGKIGADDLKKVREKGVEEEEEEYDEEEYDEEEYDEEEEEELDEEKHDEVEEEDDEDDDDDDEDDEDDDDDDEEEVVEKKMKKESFNIPSMKEDVAALIKGEDLSEEFKTKAATIFEAAVINRVKQEAARLEEAFEAKLAEEVKTVEEGLVDKVNGYLDYVVEQWMEQNEIALENGMKSDITEGFIGGLKTLFMDHYIDIPEEKYDVVGELEGQVTSLKSKLDESFEDVVTLRDEIKKYQKDITVSSLSEGLTETEKEKFHSLVEDVNFDDTESYVRSLKTIRESYFTPEKGMLTESFITDEPVIEEKPVRHTGSMSQYVNLLDRQQK